MNENYLDAMPNAEALDAKWRHLKQEAPARADELMEAAEIESLSLDEQINALKAILEDIQSDNDNRYVYRIISLVLEERMLDRSYASQKKIYRDTLAAHGAV